MVLQRDQSDSFEKEFGNTPNLFKLSQIYLYWKCSLEFT